ncbi:MAG: RNA-binding cell elongation regulator Jag/EloR [Dethiobacteria bacterium]|jgi:spoIIIJ-associated protein|nr:protein jag [Bacillota bacterium]HOP68250.1 RNA-binding cell elongation regulator Jag/EloR [Bacillota bacterium]HPT33120.1 RNA-binding cell elongation regulator Jag/EloR [Bacillota bacterium]HPZ64207.1 RNA-binding cell elongation regulator Jag/EloR [Bacillota bacterium]HQD05176.1 RNA-binding cell elongation regulator Jag/EloR [Bacillota bacterium]
MREIETSGRSVEEAVEKALAALGVKKGNAEIVVLSEPSQGFLGLIGSKEARVRVSVKYEPVEYLHHFLQELLEKMGLGDNKIQVREEEEYFQVEISGRKSGVLIGRRGRTLNDLQYLLNTILKRQFQGLKKRVVLDVGNYRARREETLRHLALGVARKVKQSGREVALEPMTPQDRRTIHLALQNDESVQTYSKGEEPYRRVIVAPV